MLWADALRRAVALHQAGDLASAVADFDRGIVQRVHLPVGQAVAQYQRKKNAEQIALYLLQLKTGANRLHPKMIFFVNHDAKGLPPIYDHRATGALGGMLPTDKMAFHQNLPVQRGEVLQAFRKRLLHFRKRFHTCSD